MQPDSIFNAPLCRAGRSATRIHVLIGLLFVALSSAAVAQRPSLHGDVLTLPYVTSSETAYRAELSLLPQTEPVRFELLASQPLAMDDSLHASTFADNTLFITDIDVGNEAYWLELILIESETGSKVLFEVSDFGVHAPVSSSNQLGLSAQPQWQRLPGSASDIGVGADGSVWVIGTDERGGGYGIYHWLGDTWQRLDGGAVRIDVDPQGVPWIVNDSHSIYRLQNGSWQRMGGNARDIGIGADGTVWVTSGGGTYRYDPDVPGSWVGVRGSGVRIDVDPNGVPWVIDHTNDIHQLIAGRWVRRNGEARDIGVGGEGSVWIIGTSRDDGGHRIYRWSGTQWNRVSGSSRQISVGPDGFPWAANSGGDIYRSQ